MGTAAQIEVSAPASFDRVVRQTASFGLTSAAVCLLVMVKSILVAARYGTGAEMDAFTLAMILPNVLAGIAAGNWAQTLVPALAGAAQVSRSVRANSFRAVLLLCLAFSVIVAVLLFVFASPLVTVLAPAFDSTQAAHATRLLRVLAPYTAMSVLCGCGSAELLSRRKYFLVASTPAIGTSVTIAMILAMPGAGADALAYGTVLGAVLQAALVLTIALRHNRSGTDWQWWTPFARRAVADQVPLLGAAAFGVANAAIDQAMAGLLEKGSLSALSYGTALNALLVQTIVMSASWIALPEFAELASSGQIQKLRARARQFMAAQAAVAAPLAAAILVFGVFAIRVVFERKTFTAQSTTRVASVWAAYSLGLLPMMIGMVCVRILNALSANRVLLLVGATMLPLNLVLDYVLMQHFGVMGIGLSTSIVYCFSALLLLALAGQRIGNLLNAATLRTILFALLAAISSGVAAHLVMAELPTGIGACVAVLLMPAILAALYFWFGLFRLLPSGRLQMLQLR